MAPGYIAQATVWIEPERAAVQGADPIQARQLLSSYGWIDLMRSYVVLDPVVHGLQLDVRPTEPHDAPVLAGFRLGDKFEAGPYRLEVSDDGAEVTLRSAEGDVLERARPGEPLGSTVGFEWTPPAGELSPGHSVAFAVSNPRDAARALSEGLQITLDREVTFLRVALHGRDPHQVTRVVNAVVERYVEVAAELKRAQLEERSTILLEQLEYAGENLREAEFGLENFKVATISLPSEASAPVAAGLQVTQDPVFSIFFNLRVQQEEIGRDEDATRRAMARSQEQGRLVVEALEALPAGAAGALLAARPRVEGAVALRRQNAAEYRELLETRVPGALVRLGAEGAGGWLRFPLRLPGGMAAFRNPARARRLGAEAGHPLTLDALPALEPLLRGGEAEEWGGARRFPGAAELVETLVTLPTHGAMRQAERRTLVGLVPGM